MTSEGSWINRRLDSQREAGALKIIRNEARAGFLNRIKLGGLLACGMSIMSAQQMNSSQKLRIRGKAHQKDSVVFYHPFQYRNPKMP